MVIPKISAQKDEKYVHPYEAAPFSWLVRPCLNYWEEHLHCKTIRNRFYQYYIDGEFANCSHWKERAKLCDRWEGKDDREALLTLIEMEKQRYADRMGPHLANNVWEKRTEPPPNWKKTLPETHEKRIEESLLKRMIDSDSNPSSSSCVIL